MSIYTGPHSVYARTHGVYCRGRGVNVRTARCILRFLDRELRRGWTYDKQGRRTRMTPSLARKRALYLVALARKHRGGEEAGHVKRLVYRWLRRKEAVRSA